MSRKSLAMSGAEPPQLPTTMVVTPMRTKFSASGMFGNIVGVRVDIDEPGGDDEPFGVNFRFGIAINPADGGDFAVRDGDVGEVSGVAGAVNDAAMVDDKVISFSPPRRWQQRG